MSIFFNTPFWEPVRFRRSRRRRVHWQRFGHERTACNREIQWGTTRNRASVTCPDCRKVLARRHSLPERELT